MLAARRPFGEWTERITGIDSIVKADAARAGAYTGRGAAPPPARRRLRRWRSWRSSCTRWSRTRKEADRLDGRRHAARGAVGPIPRPAPYFRQNFSQVTNPPIDSLRETRVMTLKTRLGNLGNILDEDADPVRHAAARQPGAVQRRIRARCARYMGATACEMDCTFDRRAATARPARRAARIRREAEEAVRGGCAHVVLTDERSGAGPRADPDDPRRRRRAHASGAQAAPHLHQPQRALGANASTCTTSPC